MPTTRVLARFEGTRREDLVPNVVLSPGEQAALCSLLAAEPVPGSRTPRAPSAGAARATDSLRRHLRAAHADDGHLVESIDLPGHHPDEPYTLHVDFRNGDDVIDFGLDRTRRPFDGRDIAVLTMLAPLLRRLVRSGQAHTPPGP